jgi:hypothetical protein
MVVVEELCLTQVTEGGGNNGSDLGPAYLCTIDRDFLIPRINHRHAYFFGPTQAQRDIQFLTGKMEWTVCLLLKVAEHGTID